MTTYEYKYPTLKSRYVNLEVDNMKNDFLDIFNRIAQSIYHTTKEKGFWDTERNDGEMIALIHSELSEALEALRSGNPKDKNLPEFSSVEVEFADAVIRIMDTCHARKWRLAEAILAKMNYNKTRSYKHGKGF